MSDTQIGVKITGDASGLTGAAQSGGASLDALAATVKRLVDALQPMDGAIKSAAQAQNVAVQSSKAMDSALGTLMSRLDPIYAAEKQFADGVQVLNRAMEEGKISLQEYLENMDVLTHEMEGAKTAFLEAGDAATHGGVGTAGFNREVIVLGHEMLQGNFSRIPGSLMVLAERFGGLSLSTMGWGAAIAAVGYAVYELIDRWNTVETAVHNAEGSMVMLGTANAQSEAQTRSFIDALKNQWGASNAEAAKSAQLIQSVGGAGAQYKDQILEIAAAQSQLTGIPLEEATQAVSAAFAGGAGAVLDYANKYHVLSQAIDASGTSEQQRVEAMVKGGAQTQALAAMVAALQARFVSSGQATAAAKKQLEDYFRAAAAMAESGQTPESVGMRMPSEQQIKAQPGTQAQDPNQADQDAAVGKINDAAQQRLAIETQIGLVQQAQDRGVQGAAETQMALWQQLGQVHSAAEKMAHDSAMAGLQAEMIQAQGDGDKRVEIEQRIAESVAQWSGAGSAASIQANTAVIQARQAADTAAAKEAHDRRMAGYQEELILAQNDGEQRVVIERKIAAEIASFSGANSVAAIQANNAVLQARIAADNQATEEARKAAEKRLEIDLGALRDKQAALKGDYDAQLAIEQEMLDRIKAFYGEDSTQFEAEIRKRIALRQEEADQAQRIQEIIVRGEAERAKLSMGQDVKKPRQDYGLGDLISGQPQADTQARQTQLQTDYTQQQTANVQGLLSTDDPVKQQTIYQQILTAQKTFANQSKEITDQSAAAVDQAWTKALAPVERAFSSTITGILQHTETLQQAVAKVAQSIEASLVDSAVKAAGTWVKNQLIQLTTTTTTEAQKTAAVRAGDASRLASNEGAQGAGAASQAAAASTSIGTDAAKAAAGAFAAVADIPYVGPILAPVAAATAFAAVMAYDVISAAGGMGSVPFDDMPAVLHRNEMVLPASIASPLRTAIGSWGMPSMPAIGASLPSGGAAPGGGSGGDTHLHYSPTIHGGGSDLKTMLRTQGSAMQSWLMNQHRNGAFGRS